MIFELAEDFHDAVAAMPKEHPRHRMLELLEKAIRRDIHFIGRHPTTLFQCMWNTCWWYDCPEAASFFTVPNGAGGIPPWETPEDARLFAVLEGWHDEKRERTPCFFWLRSLNPYSGRLGAPRPTVLQPGHGADVTGLLAIGDRLISGGADAAIRVWDLESFNLLATLQKHKAAVGFLVSESLHGFFSGSQDGRILRWEMDDLEQPEDVTARDDLPQPVQRFAGQSRASLPVLPVESVVLGDGRCVHAEDCGGTENVRETRITIRQEKTGEQTALYKCQGHIRALALIEGRLVAACNNNVNVWNTENWRMEATLRHSDNVDVITVLPGTRIATGCWDGDVRVWNLDVDVSLTPSKGMSELVRALVAKREDNAVHGARGGPYALLLAPKLLRGLEAYPLIVIEARRNGDVILKAVRKGNPPWRADPLPAFLPAVGFVDSVQGTEEGKLAFHEQWGITHLVQLTEG